MPPRPIKPAAPEAPRRRFGKLRIAWSVAWGVMCLLLITACFALKYRGANLELTRRGGPGPTVVEIYEGKLSLSWKPRLPYRPAWAGQINRHGFRHSVYSNGSWHVWGPLWAVGALFAAVVGPLAVLPWIRYSFSLRTLLVVTTLIAVGMALIVWTTH
jgi:hypothetical protein